MKWKSWCREGEELSGNEADEDVRSGDPFNIMWAQDEEKDIPKRKQKREKKETKIQSMVVRGAGCQADRIRIGPCSCI